VDTQLTLIGDGAEVCGCRPCSGGGGGEEGPGGGESAGCVNLVLVLVLVSEVLGFGQSRRLSFYGGELV